MTPREWLRSFRSQGELPLLDAATFDRTFALFLGLLVLLFPFMLLSAGWTSAAALAVVFVLGGAMFVVGKRGYRQLASLVALLATLGLLVLIMLSPLGLHNIALVGYPTVIALSGLLLGRPGLVLVGALSIVALFAITWAEVSGRLDTLPGLDTTYDDFVVLAITLVVLAAFVDLLVSRLRQSGLEARRNEAALHASEHKFFRVFEANPHPMSISTLDEGRLVDVNEAFLKTFEARRDELIGRTAVELGLWGDPNDRSSLLAALREHGSLRDQETSVYVLGRRRVFLLSMEWIELASGPCLLTIGTDITDRKLGEDALRESEQKFAQMFQANPSAMSISELADGRVIDVNESMIALSGYSRDELVGKTAAELGLWVDEVERERILSWLRTSGTLRGYEVRLRHKGGAMLTWMLSVELVELGGRPCLLWSSIDVTEARKLSEQLLRAQKMEALGRLAGGVAHDFKNWLTPILGYSELMLARLPEDDGHRHDLLEIRNAGRRAADLATQLLRFSRGEVSQPRVLDLNELVVTMERLLRRIIGEDVELVTELAPGVGTVRVDRSQFEQVILNLAVNARDAMPLGGRLAIETRQVTLRERVAGGAVALAPGSYAVVAIRDTGSGMDAETLSRIFEPFFTTKDFGKGTGLGLSTVYRIVKQNGGEIAVASEVGVGTTVEVYLPSASSGVDAVAAMAEPGALGGSETILLVEDQEAVRGFAVTALRSFGYIVIAAESGASALRLSEDLETRIDVLVTDVVMPGMSGPELAGRMLERRPACRVVYLSGHTHIRASVEALFEPGTQHLQKPFSAEDLARAVRRSLSRS